jgi:hypothetical protein
VDEEGRGSGRGGEKERRVRAGYRGRRRTEKGGWREQV